VSLMNVENLREIETKTGEIVKTKKNETKNREDALFLHFLQLKTNPMSLFTKQTKKQNGILQKKILFKMPYRIKKNLTNV